MNSQRLNPRLHAAEREVANLLKELGRGGSSISTGSFLRARGEEFLEKCYHGYKDLDFELFAVQFCEQDWQRTRNLLRDVLWPESQSGKSAGLIWSKDKESIVKLVARFFRALIEVRRREAEEGRCPNKSNFDRWAASLGQASLDECNEYLKTQRLPLDVTVVPELNDQWLREKKPWPGLAILIIERFMHYSGCYATKMNTIAAQTIDSLVTRLIWGTGLDFRAKHDPTYKQLEERCAEQIIKSTTMMLNKGFIIQLTKSSIAQPQIFPDRQTFLNSIRKNSSETIDEFRSRKRKAGGSTVANFAPIPDNSNPTFIQSPNFFRAWTAYLSSTWPAQIQIHQLQQGNISNIQPIQRWGINQRQAFDEVSSETIDGVLSQPRTKNKEKQGVPKSTSPREGTAPEFGNRSFPVTQLVHAAASHSAERAANYKSPYPCPNVPPLLVSHNEKEQPKQPAIAGIVTQKFASTPRQTSDDHLELVAENVTAVHELRPDNAVELQHFPETCRAFAKYQENTLRISATLHTDCNIPTQPAFVFTIQKLFGEQVRRSEPYDGRLLIGKTIDQFFSFFHAESGLIIADSLKFDFPTYDEPRIMVEGKAGEEVRFRQLKMDIEDALDEAKGKGQFKIEVTIPGLQYSVPVNGNT